MPEMHGDPDNNPFGHWQPRMPVMMVRSFIKRHQDV